MPETPSQPAGPTLQPFRLLDLPRELLVPIVRSYRSPIPEHYSRMVIYQGEINQERYDTLARLCLTHRDILPLAQEELFKRVHIHSHVTMYMLNRSMKSSERCREYAGRAESIYLGWDVESHKLMQSGAFNPRELCCSGAIECFLLGMLPLYRQSAEMLTVISSTDQFQNLRSICLFNGAWLNEPLALPNLRTCFFNRTFPTSIDASAGFKSVNLPNLRRLAVQHHAGGLKVEQIYDSIIAQLDHLLLCWLSVADVEHLLLLSTTLQSLHIEYRDANNHEAASKVLNQISRVDVEQLRFSHAIELESSDNWETNFELEKFKKVIQGKDGLKCLELALEFIYDEKPSDHVCDQALARWKVIKGELELTCIKKGIEVVAFTCSLSEDDEVIWEAYSCGCSWTNAARPK
jgi:hypothetical protein